MYAMQVAIFLLFASLGFYVRGQNQEFVQCGNYQCVNDTEVTCRNGKCQCGPNEIGNPRVQCAKPDEQCLCMLHGDPHVNNFYGDDFSLPLPCTHMIADMTTPATAQIPGGCQIVIVGLAHFAEHAENPLVSFESQIDILVITRQSRFTARIIKDKEPETSFVRYKRGGASDIQVDTTEEDGFYIMGIDACEVVIKYNSNTGFFSLLTPVGSVDSAGLCGECNPEFAGSSRHVAPTPLEWLKLLINSLWGFSPLDYSDINVYPSCSELTDRVQTCKEERKDFALEFCGKMLIERSVSRCIAREYGDRQVEIKFSDCYNSVCEGKKKCSDFAGFFDGCSGRTQGLSDFLTNGTFCDP